LVGRFGRRMRSIRRAMMIIDKEQVEHKGPALSIWQPREAEVTTRPIVTGAALDKLRASADAKDGAVAAAETWLGYLWRPDHHLERHHFWLIAISAGLLWISEISLTLLLSRFPIPFVISFHFTHPPRGAAIAFVRLGQTPELHETVAMLCRCRLLADCLALSPLLSTSTKGKT